MCVFVTDMCESGPESMIQRTSRVLVQKKKRGKEYATEKGKTDVCSDGQPVKEGEVRLRRRPLRPQVKTE